MNLAFDAKFRFASVTADERRLSEEIDDESELPATLVAKVDDIVKMHAYRDSLGLNAALIVFPGTDDTFYNTDDRDRRTEPLLRVPLDRVIAGELTGVGAIAMQPAQA